MGDARGWFEGNTLVVETTNFSEKLGYRGSSEKLKLTERFTPTGPDTVEWSVTFDDAATWARAWTFAMTLTKADEPPFEYACHEGNYAMFNMLSTARAEEAARARGVPAAAMPQTLTPPNALAPAAPPQEPQRRPGDPTTIARVLRVQRSRRCRGSRSSRASSSSIPPSTRSSRTTS